MKNTHGGVLILVKLHATFRTSQPQSFLNLFLFFLPISATLLLQSLFLKKVYIAYQLKYLKVRLPTSKKICFICFNGSSLKMMNIAFFILETLFVLKIFKFLSLLFGHVEETA